jgi:hypothetical protein
VTPGPPETLLGALPGYADRGVSAPEGFTEVSGDVITLRLWYLARDSRGQVRLAFAQGRGPTEGGLPALEPYPANPILQGDSPVLGGDCSLGCRLTGASVTPNLSRTSEYQLLVTRSRLTAGGPIHDVVPLLQNAPRD